MRNYFMLVKFAEVHAALTYIIHSIFVVPILVRIFETFLRNGNDETLELVFSRTGQSFKFIVKSSKDLKSSDIVSTLSNSYNGVHLTIHHAWHMLYRMTVNPRLALTEAYVDGDWDANPSPKSLLCLLIRAKRRRSRAQHTRVKWPRDLFEALLIGRQYLLQDCAVSPSPYYGSAILYSAFCLIVAPLIKLYHHVVNGLCRLTTQCYDNRQNTIEGSRVNIHEHYDLGNEMFELFLDKSMTYSCPVFPDEKRFAQLLLSSHDATVTESLLREAQHHKNNVILELLDVGAQVEAHVLEIGCGWGAMAIQALGQRPKWQWTGVTLSQEQLQYAEAKLRTVKLDDSVQLKLMDYREISGLFDAVVAVEMLEAVGHDFLPIFFRTLVDRVRIGGPIVIQCILCPDANYEAYRRSDDFIKKHIFPGGHLPSLRAIRDALPSNLTIIKVRRIGRHYVPALDTWSSRWLAAKSEICERLGRSPRFFRKWQMYFGLCSALFQHGNIDDVQILLRRTH